MGSGGRAPIPPSLIWRHTTTTTTTIPMPHPTSSSCKLRCPTTPGVGRPSPLLPIHTVCCLGLKSRAMSSRPANQPWQGNFGVVAEKSWPAVPSAIGLLPKSGQCMHVSTNSSPRSSSRFAALFWMRGPSAFGPLVLRHFDGTRFRDKERKKKQRREPRLPGGQPLGRG